MDDLSGTLSSQQDIKKIEQRRMSEAWKHWFGQTNHKICSFYVRLNKQQVFSKIPSSCILPVFWMMFTTDNGELDISAGINNDIIW